MKHHQHNRTRSAGYVLSRFAIVLAALLIVLVPAYLTDRQPAADAPHAYGDLETRFAPTLTIERNGRTYSHYDNYYTNILFIGVDETDLSDASDFRSGGQADFLLLVTLDRHNRVITPLHIDRDTIAEVNILSPFGQPAGTRRTQICLSNAFGQTVDENTANTVQAVSTLLGGIQIDYYFVLDMDGITLLNDVLGGVTVTLEEDFSALDPAMTPGATIRLEGRQAEYFVRGRQNVGDGSNAQRMSRQRVFLTGASSLLETQTRKDAAFISTVFEALGDHVHTNMTVPWLIDLTYELGHYTRREITDLPGEHRMGADGFIEFHPNEDELQSLIIDVFYE